MINMDVGKNMFALAKEAKVKYYVQMAEEVTTKQAAKVLGVSHDTIARWVKSGKIKARRKGLFPGKTSPILIPMSELARLKKLMGGKA